MTIGEKIKSLRISKGLTQSELGKRCGTTKQTIFKYETGIVANIPLDRLRRIADALGVSTSCFVGDSVEKAKTIREVFPQRYRYYMVLHGKTRQDIVRDLGFKYTTIRDWESGETIPRPDKIERLAQYFGCKNSDLLQEPQVTKSQSAPSNEISDRKRVLMNTILNSIETISEDDLHLIVQVVETIRHRASPERSRD